MKSREQWTPVAARAQMPVPTESAEQQALMQWVGMNSGRLPGVELLFHIPNGGSRGKAEAGRFKAEGVRSGVPDLFLPVPRGKFHGLFIEMKRRRGGRLSVVQKMWINSLIAQGYQAVVCYGWEHAAAQIEVYMGSKGQQNGDGQA